MSFNESYVQLTMYVYDCNAKHIRISCDDFDYQLHLKKLLGRVS
jgi:hypothetical protein